MPHFTPKTKTPLLIIEKFSMIGAVIALLFLGIVFLGIGIASAQDRVNRPTRPVTRVTENQETEETQKPTLFPGDGSFLASLRFWDKDKSDKTRSPSTPAPAPPSEQSAESQNVSENHVSQRQPDVPILAESPETNFAPVPPPNPYAESGTPPGNAPLPRQSAGNAANTENNTFVPKISQPQSNSYVSYSFDTRDWIDTFSPQYEQNVISEETSAEVPKTAHHVPTPYLPSNPNGASGNSADVNSADVNSADGNMDWNGLATTLVPPEPSEVVQASPAAEKPAIDLTPSYQKRLPHVQTCGVVVVQANFPLNEIASILEEINLLQHDLTRYIGVPEPKEKIELCLFKDNDSYTRFLGEYFPRAPLDRRALYVKLDRMPGTLMVQKTKDFDIDLRHEMTHAILHASIPTVPIWLDEGLAKYFEVPAQDRLGNNPYMSQIRWNIKLGVVPSLERLVQLETIDDMGSKEYRDSWAWAHFLIHRSPDTHRLLAGYLTMLANWTPPEKKTGSTSRLSSAGQKVKTMIVREFLGRDDQDSIPSLKLYLDDVLPNQREIFKEHFGAVENNKISSR